MSRKNLGSREVYLKDIVRIGYIGLGGRGRGVPEGCVAEMKDVDVRGICDLNPAKMDIAENILKEKGRPAAARYTDYHELLRDPEIDAVMLMTGWNGRIQMATDCLEAGKRVAIEVGCAYDITECRKLVEACERTGIPCMMPENSCCERREMMILKLAKEGFFGENRPVRRRLSSLSYRDRTFPQAKGRNVGHRSLPSARVHPPQLRKLSHPLVGSHHEDPEHQPGKPHAESALLCHQSPRSCHLHQGSYGFRPPPLQGVSGTVQRRSWRNGPARLPRLHGKRKEGH